MPDLPTLAEPRLKFFADLRVEVGAPQQVGQTVHGLRRLIPITGGTATGDGWSARQNRRFAGPFGAIGTIGIQGLDDTAAHFGQGIDGWHRVIGKIGVGQAPALQMQLLIEGPTNSLRCCSAALSMNSHRVERLATVVGDKTLYNLHLSSLGIHLDLDRLDALAIGGKDQPARHGMGHEVDIAGR